MAADNEPDDHPWYRTPTAVFMAGGVGLILIAALVFTVVQMSDQWSKPVTTVLTTTTAADPETTSREKQPFVITPSDTPTTSFTTSVQLSTTDIGLPAVTSTTSGTETTSGSPTTGSPLSTAPGVDAPVFPTQGRPSDDPTSPRKRPRLNETRTYSPGY